MTRTLDVDFAAEVILQVHYQLSVLLYHQFFFKIVGGSLIANLILLGMWCNDDQFASSLATKGES